MEVKALTKSCLKEKGLKSLSGGALPGEVIDEEKLPDLHDYSIAPKATVLKPNQLKTPTDEFAAQFGITWEDALNPGKVFYAMDGCKHLGLDSDQLDAAWAQAKKCKKLVKFGGVLYCGLVEVAGKELV